MIEPHNHCWNCGKVLPPRQGMCVNCVEERLIDEDTPREPYYKEIIKPYPISTQTKASRKEGKKK